MENISHDIQLDDITLAVWSSKRDETYMADYQKAILYFLWMKSQFYFEEDMLSKYPGQTLDYILFFNSNIIQFGHEPRQSEVEDSTLLPVYYDLCTPLCVDPSDSFFSLFFAYKLGHCDIMTIDSFLDYQLKKNFDNDLLKFSRFLVLLVRKHKYKIINQDTARTAGEWFTLKEKLPSPNSADSSANIAVKKKGVIRRMQNDNITTLSQEQTVLLFSMLQRSGVFLRDEYLTDADAGKAFDILTGYSQHTIRQKLARYTEFATSQNLQALKGIITQMTAIINESLKGAHPDNQRKLAS